MKQDPKTEKWYDKPGSRVVRSLGKINPNKNSSWSNKYNSKTLYMAVRKNSKNRRCNIMIHKRIFICLLLLSVVLSACDNKTAERSNENTMDIKG